MEDSTSTSTSVRWGDWLVLVDPGWREITPEVMPTPEVILGGWMIGEDDVSWPFEPNPAYVPTGPRIEVRGPSRKVASILFAS